MGDFISYEQLRLIVVTALSSIVAILTPTFSYVLALVIMFAFNIWCGMRADGVAIKRCQRFKFSKFKNALFELLLYLVIIEVISSELSICGDKGIAQYVAKILTYIFGYVYLQNAFRNLIIAYPKKVVLRVIYHVIRLEFVRALPEHIRPIVERYEREHEPKELKEKEE